MFENPNIPHASDFQSLLNYKFNFKGQYDKNEAAIFIDRRPDTVQKYCNGKLSIPADIARDLIKFIASKNQRDAELLEFFCLPAGYLPIPSVEVKICEETRRIKQIGLSIFNGKALEAIEEIYSDNKVEKNEYKKVHRLLTKIRELAAELDEQIKTEAKI